MNSKRTIIVEHVKKTFNAATQPLVAIEDVSFTAEAGKITCLMGSSGSGKSTLLRILAGLDHADHGTILNVPPRIGFVFQNFGLFPWLTVEQNIGFGLKMQNVAAATIDKTVRAQIKSLGLSGFERTLPKELSGGMRQRVGIGRALAIEPDILLLDEPFSALDEITAADLRDELLLIWQRTGKTIIMVTHLAEEAAYLSDSIVVVSKRPAHTVVEMQNPLPRPRDQRNRAYFALVDKITSHLSE